VDAEIDVLDGPHRVQQNGNIGIPKLLRQAIGLEVGKNCHWMLNPHMPGTLVLVPSAQVARAMGEIAQAIADKGK
jgi:bifunctional DNA-binding transcriptional regulator/antitoxin component of YhaV-PrlF toxin-antitoxin module